MHVRTPSSSPHEVEGPGRGIRERLARPLLPAASVLLALSALVALSIVVQRGVDSLRREIADVYDPARMGVRELQFYLLRETAGTRGFLLTGDSSYARRHREAREQRAVIVQELRVIAARSPDAVRIAVDGLTDRLRLSDALLDSLYAGRLSRAAYVERLPLQQQRLESISSQARDVGILLSRMAASRVDALEVLQHRAMYATFVIAALAGIALLLVVNLGLAYRALATREAEAREESERARAEADARRAEIERIAASRAHLVRGFTHDVKNPLGAAAGCLQLAGDGILEVPDAMRRARRSIDSALRLIDDLLQLAQVESSGVLVRHDVVDLRALATELVDEWRAIADAKGIELRAELPPDELVVVTDGEKVRQIVGNLVSNAVRYTAAGHVLLRVTDDAFAAREDTQHGVCIEVRDTGLGLSAEQRAGLFEEFRRFDSSAGTKGYGLGLAISSRLAAALGARLTVASEVGTGSSFCLWLPRAAEASPSALGTSA